MSDLARSLAGPYNKASRPVFPYQDDTDMPASDLPPMDPSMGMGMESMNQDFPGMSAAVPPNQSMVDFPEDAPPVQPPAPRPRPGSYFGRSGVPFGAGRDFQGRMMPPNVPAMNVMPQPGAG